MSLITFEGRSPKIDPDAFVASGARLIGDVEMAAESSVWYNCVLRGDMNRIRIGARSNPGRQRHPCRSASGRRPG